MERSGRNIVVLNWSCSGRKVDEKDRTEYIVYTILDLKIDPLEVLTLCVARKSFPSGGGSFIHAVSRRVKLLFNNPHFLLLFLQFFLYKGPTIFMYIHIMPTNT